MFSRSRFFAALLVLCASNIAHPEVPANPWLARASYAISHHDPAQSDSTAIDGPRVGKRLQRDDVKTVPLLWSSAPTYKHVEGGTVVVAANPAGIIKVRADDENFTRVSSVAYPGREDVHKKISDERLAETMADIVEVHYPGIKKDLLAAALNAFYDLRDVPGLKKKPSTSELLDWLKLLLAEDVSPDVLASDDRRKTLPPLHGALLKNEQDVHLFERMIFLSQREGR